MAEVLKPCPFCGGSARPMHKDDCYFAFKQKLKDAPIGDLSLVPDLLAAWNRRISPSSDKLASPTLMEALTDGIPLQEPVNIGKALRAHRLAKVVLSGGVGPVAAVHLVNIGLTGWVHTKETAEAYAKGYNDALNHYRGALLDVAERASLNAEKDRRTEVGAPTNSNEGE